LDFTHPVTGTLFFAPSLDFLAALAADDATPATARAGPSSTSQSSASQSPAGQSPDAPARTARRRDGNLNIGSLKGTPQHG
jgi:putative iron-dependent peroxidase